MYSFGEEMLNLAATLEYSAKTNPSDPALYFSER